jgi:hypothetical protein
MPPVKAAWNAGRSVRRYNHVHSSTRIIIENAFGRLKNRFRLLLGKVPLCLKKTRLVARALCLLHNRFVPRPEYEGQEEMDNEEFNDLLGEAVPVAPEAELKRAALIARANVLPHLQHID